jgi:branched-chain amino acid transport system permease protein
VRQGLRTPAAALISLLAPLLLVALVVAVGASGTRSIEDTTTLILCDLIIVLGLQVFIGNSGVYSFGQLGFAAVGAYAAGLATLPAVWVALQTPAVPEFIVAWHPGTILATSIAGLLAACFAGLIALPLMRTSSLAIPISTFAFLVVIYNVLSNWDELTGGSAGLVTIPRTTGLISAALWACFAIFTALTFKWSKFGYRLQASRENEVAAASLGIRVTQERIVAFVLSAALCGIGGALATHQTGVLAPVTFYFAATVTTLTMLVVGGSRSVLGATLGTVAVASINEVLRNFEEGAVPFGLVSFTGLPGLAAFGLGLILLATMIRMPNGLTRGFEADELWRWSASPRLAGPPKTPLEKASSAKSRHRELKATGISVAFAGLRVLDDVTLQLETGQALGLIGPNGAGKTTLVNVLSGYQRPDAGSVTMDGLDVSRHSPAKLARIGLTRTFQSALPFSQMTALENVAVGAMGVGAGQPMARRTAYDILGALGLIQFHDRLAASLSPGNQRLLGIARALATNPSFLLLDEPAAGLNDEESLALAPLLRGVIDNYGCGLLLIEHDMSVVMDLCPRVQVLNNGTTLRVGPAEEVQRDPAVIEAYLGTSYSEVARA